MSEGQRPEVSEWIRAVQLLVKFGGGNAHLDDLLEDLPLGKFRWLILATFRDWLIIEGLLRPRMRREPRPESLSLIRLAVAECLNRDEATHPKVVHHAGEVARALGLSKPEGGFVNGILRNILRAGEMKKGPLSATHPDWMTRRWKETFGESATTELLKWNQSLPSLYLQTGSPPEFTEATEWPGYFRIPRTRFTDVIPDLQAGTGYVQDPFARIPVELLAPQPGEKILDLCAAPGGKSRLIAACLAGEGDLFLVDRPGKRLERLKANVAHFESTPAIVIGSRLEELEMNGPGVGLEAGSMDGVLIDVPCSNTGVIQKRPDVKIRLKEADVSVMADAQLALLDLASRWVRPGGRLVYSTCSLEPEENRGVVEAFCGKRPEWSCLETRISLPWECGHDGGGAFLLTRTSVD